MPQIFNNIYRVERELGTGGFGTVYFGRDDVSRRLAEHMTGDALATHCLPVC